MLFRSHKFQFPTKISNSEEHHLKPNHNKKNRKRISEIENRLGVAKGEVGGRGLDWEFETSRCKLVYTESINNKVLLYSIGNYIQYPVINHNGKEYEKEYIYVYMYVCKYTTESLSSSAETNTTM